MMIPILEEDSYRYMTIPINHSSSIIISFSSSIILGLGWR